MPGATTVPAASIRFTAPASFDQNVVAVTAPRTRSPVDTGSVGTVRAPDCLRRCRQGTVGRSRRQPPAGRGRPARRYRGATGSNTCCRKCRRWPATVFTGIVRFSPLHRWRDTAVFSVAWGQRFWCGAAGHDEGHAFIGGGGRVARVGEWAASPSGQNVSSTRYDGGTNPAKPVLTARSGISPSARASAMCRSNRPRASKSLRY